MFQVTATLIFCRVVPRRRCCLQQSRFPLKPLLYIATEHNSCTADYTGPIQICTGKQTWTICTSNQTFIVQCVIAIHMYQVGFRELPLTVTVQVQAYNPPWCRPGQLRPKRYRDSDTQERLAEPHNTNHSRYQQTLSTIMVFITN